MQKSVSCKSTWAAQPISSGSSSTSTSPTPQATTVEAAVSGNAVIVFGRSGCFMCHVARRLLLGHGVNPTVFEVGEKDEASVIEELTRIAAVDGTGIGLSVQFPIFFFGGKMFGGLEKVMGAHISGDLVPILREAGALWL
ncbi:hypothetical protein SAY87_011711 [Trapa incisa]|uniref:Glutaredoxin domain-containing protein n=1 Tax=Trapa incisa TaxID=236973 RepID=A0AAN7GP17_9MYRT|nr:hypothetical protein SAY87_011711 [Trapa incisa]